MSHIPPELVRRFVDEVAEQALQNGRKHPRQLAACGTTCRYWAKLIRPVLFGHLKLNDFTTFHGLISILNSAHVISDPELHLSRYIYSIHFDVDSRKVIVGVPWSTMFKVSSQLLITFSLILRHSDCNSIHGGYPRLSPAVCRSLHTLEVDGLEFERSTDLLRFLATIPAYSQLHTFVHAETRHQERTRKVNAWTNRTPRRIDIECKDGDVEDMDVDEFAQQLDVVHAALGGASDAQPLGTQSWEVIARAVVSLVPERSRVTSCTAEQTGDNLILSVVTWSSTPDEPKLGPQNSLTFRIALRAPGLSVRGVRGYDFGQTEAIHIAARAGLCDDGLAELPWLAFEHHYLQLEPLPFLEIDSTRHSPLLARVLARRSDVLRKSHGRGRLRFRIEGHFGGEAVSRDHIGMLSTSSVPVNLVHHWLDTEDMDSDDDLVTVYENAFNNWKVDWFGRAI